MGITARQKRVARVTLLLACASVAAGLLIGTFSRYQFSISSLALAIVVLVGAFISMVPRWQMLDHMQKDSRLTSWYWGGGFGGGAGLVVALMFSGVRSPFFAGAALVWLLQCTGYAIARFRWWLAHRSEAV
jgi:hypothetical protein